MRGVWPRGLGGVALVLSFLAVAATTAGSSQVQLVSPELLKAGRLQTVWANQLPLKPGEGLESLTIIGTRLYVLSDRNYMLGMDRSTGNVTFARSVAPQGLPVYGMELHGNVLLSVVGNELLELDADSGQELKSRKLPFGVACPAVRNDSYYYVAGSDKRVHVFRALDMVEIFDVAAEDDSPVVSVRVGENFIVFATRSGKVTAFAVDRPVKLWQFNAAGAVVEPVVVAPDAVYFSSTDTNVYKLAAADGKLIWKYQADAILDSPPSVTEDHVYQYVYGKGLTALDAETGRLIWKVPAEAELLAQAGSRAYLFNRTGRLVVMDNAAGGPPLYAVNFAAVSRFASNQVDSRIYVAGGQNMVVCLEVMD